MTLKFTKSSATGLAQLLASRPAAPNPTGQTRVLPDENKESREIVKSIVQQTDAQIAAEESFVEAELAKPMPEVSTDVVESEQLVPDDFPFDPSQLEAIHGVVQQKYACLTGAAGTGKTTVTKKIVDLLRKGVGAVDLKGYWKYDKQAEETKDTNEPSQIIPSICMAAFTGRAAQMVAKNFPRSWHSNIMTIHRMLGFKPEYFEDIGENGDVVNSMRFVPSYTAENRMPWDIIIIDEAGMCGLDLWHMVWAACKENTRIILIGDINQLPPTHGKSIFGFAMGEWASWELTHVHRQKGANNSIVDNAHRVLKGQRPQSDCKERLLITTPTTTKAALTHMLVNKDWRFLTLEIDEGSTKAGAWIRESLKLLKGAKFYDPNRDAVITAINGYDIAQLGAGLGQDTMNRELSMILNPDNPRYIIDGGHDRKNFAVGDKVMATKNDWEAGITNGMTGIIKSIADHSEYTGDRNAYGRADKVQEWLDSHDDEDFDLSMEDIQDYKVGEKTEKEKMGRGPASHILTIVFGEGDSAIEMTFSTQAEVGSIQLAYVTTCHKMQGGEAPLVFVIVHQSHKRMLNREWLYTAITRASQRCVLLVTRDGLGNAVGKQTIKGRTLQEKVAAFQALQKIGIAGAAVNVKMPRRTAMEGDQASIATRVEAEVTAKVTVDINITVKEVRNESPRTVHDIDGGDITPVRPAIAQAPRLIPQVGAAKALMHMRAMQSRTLLPPPEAPKTAPILKPVKKPVSLADLMKGKK